MQTSHIGTSDVIFAYNGRDGVITDFNGLAYMRARYYSPNMRRFINADIIHGTISDSTSLNRYSYVNGNPVSFVDPFGLSPEIEDTSEIKLHPILFDLAMAVLEESNSFRSLLYDMSYYEIISAIRPKNVSWMKWHLQTSKKIAHLDDALGPVSKLSQNLSRFVKVVKVVGEIASALSVSEHVLTDFFENIENGESSQKIVSDAIVDVEIYGGIIATSSYAGSLIGGFIGNLGFPILGALAGAAFGYALGELLENVVECDIWGDRSILDIEKDIAEGVVYQLVENTDDILIWFYTGSSFNGGGGSYGLTNSIFGMKEFSQFRMFP